MREPPHLLDELSVAVLIFQADAPQEGAHSSPLSLRYHNQRAASWLALRLEGARREAHEDTSPERALFEGAEDQASQDLGSTLSSDSSSDSSSGEPLSQVERALTFEQVFPEARLDRLLKRLKRGLIAEFILELSDEEGRELPVRFTLKLQGGKGALEGGLMVEGFDHSAARESEHMLASYSELIENKTRSLSREQRRVERLLFNILPEKCIQQLRQFGRTTPERFEEVSVMFLDFVGFTELSQKMPTEKLFSELNEIFTAFDHIISEHRCERIKTIGDAYLAVCGMPNRIPDHAELITSAAFKMRRYIEERNAHSQHVWRCRIGLHTGEVTGGVVGKLKYIYDVFGDGVNTASRMESYSEPMKINLSTQLRSRLSSAYVVSSRGLQEVKGKGAMEMFFLEDIIGEPCEDRLMPASEMLDPQDSLVSEG